ncbi:putative membrane protein [Trachipleistophora hominis]|uniref:Post-GPI attachment to proteins factor 3 n=1 Tax=Trachipleistophora hominis TaxID=72359 RepID=L7JXK5_TRAHO|nr:putative membrane protein [Trachipleistophora hominis]
MSSNQLNIVLESTSSLRSRLKDFFGWFCAYLIESQDTGANEPIKMVSRDSTKNSSHTTALTGNNDGKYQLEDHKDDIFKFHKMSPEQIKRFIDAYTSFYNDHAPTYTIIDKLFLRTPSRIKERHAHLAALRALNIQNIKRRDRYAFLPIWQCTEIISVLLSALSLLNTIIMYHTRIQGRLTPLHNLYTMQYRISCITWISSILLHIDDNRITRFCDYFSALLGIMYYFYTVIVRLLLSFKVSNIKEVTTHIFNALTLVYISVVYHNITNFNSRALKFVSGVFIILFLVAIVVQSIFFPNKFIKYIVVLTIIGVTVESSDIEPFCFVLDSHAMWHFVIGIQNFYYNRYLAEEITLMGGNL